MWFVLQAQNKIIMTLSQNNLTKPWEKFYPNKNAV